LYPQLNGLINITVWMS